VAGVITVTAEDLAFDTACLALPAGQAVTIAFINNDSQPHNIAIYTDSDKSTQLFEGEIIDLGEAMEYDVPAQDTGTYYFDCTVHTAMNGRVVVD